MTGTYQLPDGTSMSLGSPKNVALYKKIVAKEVLADLTSVVQGCLDADLLTDGSDPIIDPDGFLNRKGQHSCPYCAELIAQEDQITDVVGYLESTTIPVDEDDADFPFLCPVCGARHHSESAARYCCEESIIYQCRYCNSIVDAGDLQPVAVPYDAEQWLVVSQWLGRCLSLVGEAVFLSNEGAYLWARDKQNPKPEHDPKIAAICCSLELLEGQKNFREVK